MTDGEAAERLLETAFDVARRYNSFGSYGSEAAAVRALHRRCPGVGKEECRNAFHQAVTLYDVTRKVYDKHKEMLLETWQTPNASEAADFATIEISQVMPNFSLSACRSALSWIFYWYAL